MPAAEARSQTPVDLTHLARYTGGDQAINAEVLQLFLRQSAEILHKLHAALKAHDLQSWRELAHSLKGAARGIGAFAMADAAEAIEPVTPDDARAVEVLAGLDKAARPVVRFIEGYLGR
jgi:HPt (histidine-containing phosphotransfer) domain-containing protein